MNRLFKKKRVVYFVLLSMMMMVSVSFAEDWEVRAGLEVKEVGLTEAILPAELLLKTSDGYYDLSLKGPDNNPRAFELYKKEKTGKKKIVFAPQKIELSADGGFIWECDLPDLLLSDLQVTIADRNYLGKIHVEAKDLNGWFFIAKNQAVYQTGASARASIIIKKGKYKKIRLQFSSFDKKYRKKIVAIKNITGVFEKTGKSYQLKTFDLSGKMRIVESDDFTEIRTILPGSGLDIKSVDLSTLIQFQGQWEAGYEIIQNGKSEFVRLKSGQISHFANGKEGFSIQLEQEWPGKSMLIRLKPETGFIGDISALKLNAHLPRFLFFADTKGTYLVYTAMGKKIKLLEYPGDLEPSADKIAVFEKPERNSLYNTKTLVEKYQIKGGPFDEDGYAWNSVVAVPEPGYYRLKFNLEASLDKNYKKVRLVKNGLQVPFFFGANENKSIELPAVSDYDAQKNQTSWIITLPEASNQWRFLLIAASGIFKRDLLFYKKKPGNTGWEQILSKKWQNTDRDGAQLKLDLQNVFKRQTSIKIVINHGDNQPLYIKSFQAFYSSPSLYFLAYETGDYTIFGGNEKVAPANFDLSLIQQRLLEMMPVEIEIPEIEKKYTGVWNKKILKHFQEQGWGLYIILGIVTVMLLLIIIRLFPAIEKKEQEKRITER